ncbi:MAG TPA: LysM domain-containing protein [Solirubrobacterales bacterium]|jgi:LysM repeat protein|nr:LysM domain-containing protein [Solirubrobacterales bacterium]
MKRKRSWIARFLALAALAAAVVAIVVVASNTDLHSKSSHKSNGGAQAQNEGQQHKKPRTKAKTYEVQSGDTLTAIAHKTGVPLAELQALNPELDPQTLIAGEVLKLQK